MLMSEFITNVLQDFRSLPGSLPGNQKRMHPLVKLESAIEYIDLENHLKKYLDCHDDVSQHLDKIQKIIHLRFSKTFNTIAHYQINPYTKVNCAYAILAKHVATLRHVPIYDVLFPNTKLTKEIYLLNPHEFIFLDRDGELIAVSVMAYIDGLKKARVNPIVGPLSPIESRLIFQHSEEARRYANAVFMQEDEETLALRRSELEAVIKLKTYPMTANYGKAGEKHLALSILPSIYDWRQLVVIMSTYIPREDWGECLNLINNDNLFKAMLGLHFKELDLESTDIIDSFKKAINETNACCAQFQTFFAAVKEKEQSIVNTSRIIPDLMHIVSTFKVVEMLEKSDWNFTKFKELIITDIGKAISALPRHSLDAQLKHFTSKEALANAIADILVQEKQNAMLKRLSISDLFIMLMHVNLSHYQNQNPARKRKLTPSELLLTHISDSLIKRLTAKIDITVKGDDCLRAYYYLLAEVYLRQRDLSGDSFLANTNSKFNKMQACQLFQQFLSSHYALHELYLYPLESPISSTTDLSSLYGPLTSDTLGLLSSSAIQFGNMLDQNNLEQPALANPSVTEDKKDLSSSWLARVQGWESLVEDMLKIMTSKQWKAFLEGVYSCETLEQATHHLISHALEYATQLDTVLSILVDFVPMSGWKAIIGDTGLIHWFGVMTDIDMSHLKARSKGDALKFQANLWSEVDEGLRKLVKQTRYFHSDMHTRAYAFCLAMTYKRQRDKRGDYGSSAAKTASLLSVTSFYSTIRPVHEKKDKLKACDALIDFILDTTYQFTEADLKAYLVKNYKDSAEKYLSILTHDTLGKLTQHILSHHLAKCRKTNS
jgi:hypothetical protein